MPGFLGMRQPCPRQPIHLACPGRPADPLNGGGRGQQPGGHAGSLQGGSQQRTAAPRRLNHSKRVCRLEVGAPAKGPAQQQLRRCRSHREASARLGPWAQRTRDYYRIEDDQGRRYWIFREGLYGREDADRLPGWWLHGVFA